MRWYWLDKFEAFQSGVKSQAIKCISLGEDHMHDHFLRYPVMPHSLVLEGIAQTGGLLICEHYKYERKVVLAKFNKAVFYDLAYPGDTLVYRATVERYDPDGTVVTASSKKRLSSGEEIPHADVEMLFANLDESYADKEFYSLRDYRNLMVALRLYEVGFEADGVTPLKEPEIFKHLDYRP